MAVDDFNQPERTEAPAFNQSVESPVSTPILESNKAFFEAKSFSDSGSSSSSSKGIADMLNGFGIEGAELGGTKAGGKSGGVLEGKQPEVKDEQKSAGSKADGKPDAREGGEPATREDGKPDTKDEFKFNAEGKLIPKEEGNTAAKDEFKFNAEGKLTPKADGKPVNTKDDGPNQNDKVQEKPAPEDDGKPADTKDGEFIRNSKAQEKPAPEDNGKPGASMEDKSATRLTLGGELPGSVKSPERYPENSSPQSPQKLNIEAPDRITSLPGDSPAGDPWSIRDTKIQSVETLPGTVGFDNKPTPVETFSKTEKGQLLAAAGGEKRQGDVAGEQGQKGDAAKEKREPEKQEKREPGKAEARDSGEKKETVEKQDETKEQKQARLEKELNELNESHKTITNAQADRNLLQSSIDSLEKAKTSRDHKIEDPRAWNLAKQKAGYPLHEVSEKDVNDVIADEKQRMAKANETLEQESKKLPPGVTPENLLSEIRKREAAIKDLPFEGQKPSENRPPSMKDELDYERLVNKDVKFNHSWETNVSGGGGLDNRLGKEPVIYGAKALDGSTRLYVLPPGQQTPKDVDVDYVVPGMKPVKDRDGNSVAPTLSPEQIKDLKVVKVSGGTNVHVREDGQVYEKGSFKRMPADEPATTFTGVKPKGMEGAGEPWQGLAPETKEERQTMREALSKARSEENDRAAKELQDIQKRESRRPKY